MAKSFEELRRKMPPARQSKARARTDTMVADLALAELRRNFGVTQEQLAGLLDIRQAAISKIERRDDVLLSTPRHPYVRARRRARDHGAIRRSCASAEGGLRSAPQSQVEIETRSARSVRQRLCKQSNPSHGPYSR